MSPNTLGNFPRFIPKFMGSYWSSLSFGPLQNLLRPSPIFARTNWILTWPKVFFWSILMIDCGLLVLTTLKILHAQPRYNYFASLGLLLDQFVFCLTNLQSSLTKPLFMSCNIMLLQDLVIPKSLTSYLRQWVLHSPLLKMNSSWIHDVDTLLLCNFDFSSLIWLPFGATTY